MAQCSRMSSICTKWRGPRRRSILDSPSSAHLQSVIPRLRLGMTLLLLRKQSLPRALRKHREQVAQVVLLSGVAKQRRYPNNLLDRAKSGSVRVMDEVLVPVTFREGRE